MAGVNGDLIDDYLARLRAGLRTPPARTAEIAALHSRETLQALRTATPCRATIRSRTKRSLTSPRLIEHVLSSSWLR